MGYMEESDRLEEAANKNPLKEGVVGSKLVAYFENLDGRVAVDAESIEHVGVAQHDYKITFEGGLVQAYRVTFADGMSSEILDATPLN
jgi:hypothetical protein